MTKDRWAKMPCWWQMDAFVHSKLATVPTGNAIAALKLYVALCLRANFSSTDELHAAGSVRRSLLQLCNLTGVSKPMVIAGASVLKALGLVAVHEGRPTLYCLSNYDTSPYWTKLPSSYLFKNRIGPKILRLHLLSNRSAVTLHALQFYLYIASIRDKRTQVAKVAYDKLVEVLGINRNQVSRAVSLLVAQNLISVRQGELDEFSSGEHPSHVYWLLGSTKRDSLDPDSSAESQAA